MVSAFGGSFGASEAAAGPERRSSAALINLTCVLEATTHDPRTVSDDQITCRGLSIKSSVTPSILNRVKTVFELHAARVFVWKWSVEGGQ